jgi:hypothetical protein
LAAPFGRTLWPHLHIILSLALTISGLSDTTLLCSVEKEEEAEEEEEKEDDALRCPIVYVIWMRQLSISGYNRALFVCFAPRSALYES